MARLGNMPCIRIAHSLTSESVGRARLERANGAALGNNVSGASMLAELGTFFAARFAARSILTVLWFYFLPIWTIIVVMVHVSVLWRIFGRVRVIRGYSCHSNPFVGLNR